MTVSNKPKHYHHKIWSFAWPMMLSNITVPLLGLVDTAVLGHLEHSGYLAGVAIGSNIFTFLLWAFGFLRMGTTGLAAHAYGKQDADAVFRTLIQASGLAFIIGFILIINQNWLLPTAISWMDGSEKAQLLASTYCHIRIWGAPATLIQYALIGMYIGIHKPKASLFVLICINVLNIIFDIIFVVLLDLDVVGIALATVIAEYIGVIISLLYLYHVLFRQPLFSDTRKNIVAPFQWLKTQYKHLFTRDDLKRFFTVNGDIFIRTCCLLFVFAFFTAQGAKQGDIILATNAVLLTFLLLISNTLDGFANAAEATVGEILGKENNQQNTRYLKRFVYDALHWCILFTAILTVIFYIAGAEIVALLTDIHDVRKTADEYLNWLVIMPGLAFLSYLYDGVFVGAIRTRAMRNIMLFSLCIVFFPLWVLTQQYENHGLWFSLSAFMLARSLFMSLSYHRFIVRREAGLLTG